MKVDNGIILAAGTASRFAPLSYECPKALIEVRGEVLIERQIRQLKEAGINEIIVVTGYQAERFEYLKEKWGVHLIHNSEYLSRNNHSSIFAVKEYLKNSYICSSDNYFLENPFENEVATSYYAAIYMEGETKEWCIQADKKDLMTQVAVGGKDAWVMMGHVFWSNEFSQSFLSILEEIYDQEETKDKLWESIYIEHINELPMYIRRYSNQVIFEFDTLDELREFDHSYRADTRSLILKSVANQLGVKEENIHQVETLKGEDNLAIGFTFKAGNTYRYLYETKRLEAIE